MVDAAKGTLLQSQSFPSPPNDYLTGMAMGPNGTLVFVIGGMTYCMGALQSALPALSSSA